MEETLSTYQDESLRTDFESHANKIFTGIKEIIPTYAEKRAIWELFQNALDITDESGKIIIHQTEKGFKFMHNGKPFRVGNLTGLIKQSSNGKTYGSNTKHVGQYGTGFLSTHVYAKEIMINASVQTNRGRIKILNDFCIDRKADDPDELRIKIQDQDKRAASICDGSDFEISEHLPFTCFEYVANDTSKQYIANMFSYIPNILPYIFAFNEKLDSVTISYKNVQTEYRRGSVTKSELELLVNGSPISVAFLADTKSNIKVLLPKEQAEFKNIPKLFLYYPLMGTIDIGINFLIHAQEFRPNQERGYLNLNAASTDLKKDVDTNEMLLRNAFRLVADKIKDDSCLDFLAAVDISFTANDEKYLTNKKLELIKEIKDLERIKIGDNSVALSQIFYLSQEILILEDNIRKDIYSVISEFYQVPEYEQYIYLSERVNNWKSHLTNDYASSIGESLETIGLKEILAEVISNTNGNYDFIKNKKGYRSVIKAIASNNELLNFEVIPNIHCHFRPLKDLKRWDVVEQPLIDVMDAINSNVSSCYLHPEFYFLENATVYTREDFKDDLNKFNSSKIAQLEKNEGAIIRPDSVQFNSVVNTLTLFISLNRVTETNIRLSKYLNLVFDLTDSNKEISNPTVRLDYDLSFKLLARLYTKKLSGKDVGFIKESIDNLKEFIAILDKTPELKRNLLDKLACIPNQKYQLRAQSNLKIDECKDEVFKTKYFERTNKDIREDMVLPGFESFLHHTDVIKGMQLGETIEKALSPTQTFLPVTDTTGTLLPVLLDLIEHLSKPNSQWPQWLPNLNRVKEDILLYKFKDESTRASLFTILSGSESKIKVLGNLSGHPQMEEIIKLGLSALNEERNKRNDFDFKHTIGKHIENLVREQLAIEVEKFSVDVKPEQGGQDMIAKLDGEPVYYIEVKSQWEINDLVTLSYAQSRRSVAEQENYALCAVDLVDYKRGAADRYTPEINDVIDRMSFVTDIGVDVEELIEAAIRADDYLEDIRLADDYRVRVYKNIIDAKGISFTHFTDFLINLLTDRYPHAFKNQ